MEGFLNWIKVEGMVSNYFSSCNSEQLKNKVWDRDTHTHTHTHARTHTHTHTHTHTNYLDKKTMLRKIRHAITTMQECKEFVKLSQSLTTQLSLSNLIM